MNRSLICVLFCGLASVVPGYAQNLVTNGFGEEGNNMNMSAFQFDGTDFYLGQGSFTVPSGYQNRRTDELIPFVPGSSYQVEYYARSENPVPGNVIYPFLACYDVDSKEINTSHTLFVSGTTTELSSDLNAGDVYIYVDDLSGWVNPGAFWHQRGIRVWNYSNSLGFDYPAETYSRNFYKGASGVGLWEEGVGLDYANNRIILKNPWSGPSLTAGTALSQNHNAGTYLYYGTLSLTSEWVRSSGSFSADKILPGTAFIKLGWMFDYGSKGADTKISAIQLREMPGGLFSSMDGSVGIGTINPQNKLEVAGAIRAEEVIVEAQPWADYVFEGGYELKSLAEVEAYIEQQGRLPGMPSAEEVSEEGVSIGETQRLFLEKIEQLTLYAIEQEKTIGEMREKISEKDELLVELFERIEKLEAGGED